MIILQLKFLFEFGKQLVRQVSDYLAQGSHNELIWSLVNLIREYDTGLDRHNKKFIYLE